MARPIHTHDWSTAIIFLDGTVTSRCQMAHCRAFKSEYCEPAEDAGEDEEVEDDVPEFELVTEPDRSDEVDILEIEPEPEPTPG